MHRIIKSGQTQWIDGKWVVTAPISEVEALESEQQAVPLPDPVEVLETAYAEAQAMRAQAEREATALIENVTRAAYEDGLKQGREEAYEAAMAEWRTLLGALQAETDSFIAERTAHLDAAEPDLVRLGLLVAAKILLREPKDAALIKAVVAEAVAKLNSEAVVRVRVSPEDHRHLARPAAGAPGFEVVPDPAVGIGGCVVETKLGRVDASFATQFAELTRRLLDAPPEADPALEGAMGELKQPALPDSKPAAKPVRAGGFGGGGFGR